MAWEVTRSCNLNCRHCRASSEMGPYPDELDTEEAFAVIDGFAAAGRPIIILTGGEPLLRPDIFDLAAYGTRKGLRMVMAVNGTLLNDAAAEKCIASGIKRLSVSLDGADAASHDDFRRVPGAFAGALAGIAAARKAGLEFQVNTTVTAQNAKELPEILRLAEKEGAAAWHVFLLVPMGRGRELEAEILEAAEYEKILNRLYELERQTSLDVKLTCAPQFYRVVEKRGGLKSQGHGLHSFTRGCLGGVGFCFVSHRGRVQPCGYLELDCGNVREAAFEDIWRDSPIFARLRDYNLLKGKCGKCEYKSICGGCRARAFAATGDYLEAEPLCPYNPRT